MISVVDLKDRAGRAALADASFGLARAPCDAEAIFGEIRAMGDDYDEAGRWIAARQTGRR